jgi:hypothetical protein
MSSYYPPDFDLEIGAGQAKFYSPSVQRDLPNLPSLPSGFSSPALSNRPGLDYARITEQKTAIFTPRPLEYEFRSNLRHIVEAEENTKDRMLVAREQERAMHLRNTELEDVLHDLKEEVTFS